MEEVVLIIVGSIHQRAFVLHFHIGAVQKREGGLLRFGMQPVHAEGHMEGRLGGGACQPELESIGCLLHRTAGNGKVQLADRLRVRLARKTVGVQRQVDQGFLLNGNRQPCIHVRAAVRAGGLVVFQRQLLVVFRGQRQSEGQAVFSPGAGEQDMPAHLVAVGIALRRDGHAFLFGIQPIQIIFQIA